MGKKDKTTPSPSFDPNTLENIFQDCCGFEHKAKLSKEAQLLSAELVRQFVMETVQRAHKISTAQGDQDITDEALEETIAQLIFDFT